MPKFVSGSSGHIYAYDKGSDSTKNKDSGDLDSDLKSIIEGTSDSSSRQNETQKPSAINKKGSKEKQKNSLDLFKEELRRLTEERDEQRCKIKQGNSNAGSDSTRPPAKQLPAPVPLKPDPRCPTTLTLQANLKPKDKDSCTSGSFDTGDPTTTNLYVGNLNPSVNESDLCDIFGKFGPLASIKIMWPRTDEERARNRNSGFVAYMSRIDADRALRTLNGRGFRGYDMKLGWGKAFPLPQNPVYVPPEVQFKRDSLADILRNLDPTRVKIGDAMMFCINHSDAAQEIIDHIYESLLLLDTPFQSKIARLFLVSDILHNCSAAVTNASYYRKGFQQKLVSIFENLREYLISIEDHYKADRFKQKVLSVLGAWKEWTLYEDEFVIKLSNILLGLDGCSGGQRDMSAGVSTDTASDKCFQAHESTGTFGSTKKVEDDLDGEPVDDETLDKCLEAKGLSLRWYKALELSEDEEEFEDHSQQQVTSDNEHNNQTSRRSGERQITANTQADKIRFKASKWETVDPSELAEQVVTMSKWELMASKEECEGSTDSGSYGGDTNDGDNGIIVDKNLHNTDTEGFSSAENAKREQGSSPELKRLKCDD